MPLLRADENGLWCEVGGFHIDPWAPVDRALITHAHSDHARPGSTRYLCVRECEPLLRLQLGSECAIDVVKSGEALTIGDVSVSFHPAGHILGSAQIRLEHRGEVWVVSGDYKRAADPTCAPFEPVRCHTFVTESTFGLPIYRWPPAENVFAAIHDWWRGNQNRGRCSVLFGDPVGAVQRILAGIDVGIGPIFCDEAVAPINRIYRGNGVSLAETQFAADVPRGYDWTRALVLAPPSTRSPAWMKRFGPTSTGLASGWMRIRGTRRRNSIDRGFVLSDHADWPALQETIAETQAETVLVTHGYRSPLVRWLRESGKNADLLDTRYEGERVDQTAAKAAPEEAE
jgi:putative mRNA 3-end processing factor